MTIQELSREGLAALAPTIIAMADAEGLQAHAESREGEDERNGKMTCKMERSEIDRLVRHNIANLTPLFDGAGRVSGVSWEHSSMPTRAPTRTDITVIPIRTSGA